MKVLAILVVLVPLAYALPHSDEDDFGDWEFGGLEEELQAEIATVGYGSGAEAEVFYENPVMVEPVEPSEVGFSRCVKEWCYQEGTNEQYTRCKEVLDKGKKCVNPTIKYGTTEGGIPYKHINNDYNAWCKQIFDKELTGSVTTGPRDCSAPNGKVFWGDEYDEPGMKWCDWEDGNWRNGVLDAHSECVDAITSITCQINVDGKIEHGVWYEGDTITDLGVVYDVAKDKPCCEACKNLYGDTEFFEIHRETTSNFFYKQCACVKSKPGVVPSTYSMASLSGKCGLWEYNGEGELGKERLFVSSSTHFLGSTKNVSDASDCCDACMDKFPDTQLFGFFNHFKEEKFCSCHKTNTDDVPATWEKVYGIGTCDGPVDAATEIPADSTMDDYPLAEINVYDYNYEPFKLTRESLVRGIMHSFEAYYDTNPKDGNLTKEEFETAVQTGGPATSTNLTWEDVLKLIDENCDGAIIDLEFRGLADISFEIMSLDKDEDFYITQEELGDDKLWKTLLDQHADKDGRVDMNEYYKFMIKRYLENDRCSARPAPPSVDPLVASDESLDKLFDDGGDLGDGLDKIVVTLYRIRAAGEKTYYKETADGEMELI